MKRPFVIALLALGIAGAVVAAWPALAQGPGGQAPGGPGQGPGGPRADRPRMDRAAMQKEVGLTDAQVSQLQQLQQAERKLEIRRRADLQIARMELDELFEAATVDEKAVAARVKVLADLEAAALKASVDHRLAVRKVVTAEQLQKMKMLRPRHADRRRDGPPGPGSRGPGFGPPRGPDGPPDGPPPGDDESEDEIR
jgi:Spy/CpxP family protein refolding chaperone